MGRGGILGRARMVLLPPSGRDFPVLACRGPPPLGSKVTAAWGAGGRGRRVHLVNPGEGRPALLTGPWCLLGGWALSSDPDGGDQRLARTPGLPGHTCRIPLPHPERTLPSLLLPPVAVTPEKAEGRGSTGQLFGVLDGEKAASREGPRGLGKRRLNIDVGLCSSLPARRSWAGMVLPPL